jgi:hypothetical protein
MGRCAQASMKANSSTRSSQLLSETYFRSEGTKYSQPKGKKRA